MKFFSKFSTELYHARGEKGYTQREVAEAVSISVRWYQRVEKGERLPSSLVMLRLIIFLDLNIENFKEEVGIVVPVLHNRRRTHF